MIKLDDIRAAISRDSGLSAIENRASAGFESDPAHDRGHAFRVTLWTVRLGGEEIDIRNAIAAGLLHDVVNHPKNSSRRSLASADSATVARDLLPEHGFSAVNIEVIAQAIVDHSYSFGAVPDSTLGKALQDADRLDALGALGIMRTVATGVRMGTSLFDPEDPWATNRPLDDHRFTLDHFFTKLLRLPETMQTPGGRVEANVRVKFMVAYLKQLGGEIGADLPVAPSVIGSK